MTEPGRIARTISAVTRRGAGRPGTRAVVILGPSNLAAAMPHDASLLLARNALALLQLLLDKEGKLAIDTGDEVVAGTLLTHAGQVVHQPTAERLATAEVPA